MHMGSYGVLYFNNVDICSTKNYIDYNCLMLFSKYDYKILESIDSDFDYNNYYLLTNIEKAKYKLQILGYNENKLEKSLERFKKLNIKRYEEELENDYTLDESMILTEKNRIYDSINYYKRINIDILKKSFKIAINIRNKNPSLILDNDWKNQYKDIKFDDNEIINETVYRILCEFSLLNYFYDDIEFIEEIYNIDSNNFIYLILLSCDNQYQVKYDISELVNGGWTDPNDINKYYNHNKDRTVIITEGKTDIKILSKSLKILYPEYEYLFSFFDFYTYKSEGSTGYLVKMIKAFMGASIGSRIIAIFDNDTAAREALKSLDNMQIRDNIKITYLPTLEFCNNYPTHGPTGIQHMNINGLAVSIELFFGKDVLMNKDNILTPIQWKGYREKLNQYQGCIMNKSVLIKKMEDKLDKGYDEKLDWEPLKQLWEHIFSIYNQ